jgi:hypothetical protein
VLMTFGVTWAGRPGQESTGTMHEIATRRRKTGYAPAMEVGMHRRRGQRSYIIVLGLAALVGLSAGAAPGCGGGSGVCNLEDGSGCANGQVCIAGVDGQPLCGCSFATEEGCEPGKVCEQVPGQNPACFPPVTLGGDVFDLATDAAIEGALVVARDANFAAVSGVAKTDATGHYVLTVPVPRNEDGTLIETQVFLRADALGYLTFPAPPRNAVPIDMSKATGDPLHVETAASDVGLIALQNPDGLGTVTGKVIADVPIGTLVVAGGAAMTGGGVTGVADTDGTYTVFNVPAGNVSVQGYKAGLQLTPATASVDAGAVTTGVDLTSTGEATAIVSGKIEIVNPGMGSDTSIIFVVDETFIPNAARGEAPPGLRVFPVSGDFTLANVPDGNYVVLAAFENDFLVRDPDTSIGGTDIVRVTVSGGDVAIAESFKVTGSLDGVSPDNEEVVSGTPVFVWNDDSSEDHYEIRVFDAYGTMVWEKLDVPGVSGDKTVQVTYEGPALESGLVYQFRALSVKADGIPISATEDLRGVFLYQ